MPDFDFDAFNHDEVTEGASNKTMISETGEDRADNDTEKSSDPTPVVHAENNTSEIENSQGEQVDKW